MPVYENLSYYAYNELPGVRSSDLRAVRQSPRHYRLREKRDTDGLRIGRILHDVTAGADLESCCTVWHGAVRRGKQWEQFVAENGTAPIITETQEETIRAMVGALKEHEAARELLSRPARKELTLTWLLVDPEGGPSREVRCKARLDALTDDGTIVELKSDGVGIDERTFARRMEEYGYHLQASWYTTGTWHALELQCPVKYVVVSSRWPHDVAVYRVGDETLEAGAVECAECFQKLMECERSGQWPGAHPGVGTIELPPWYWRQSEQDAGTGLNLQGVRRGK
jgi:hypothetical protein